MQKVLKQPVLHLKAACRRGEPGRAGHESGDDVVVAGRSGGGFQECGQRMRSGLALRWHRQGEQKNGFFAGLHAVRNSAVQRQKLSLRELCRLGVGVEG